MSLILMDYGCRLRWLRLSTSPMASEGLGTDVINDGAIGRFMRPNVTFANCSFDEKLRIPAPLLAQREGALAAPEISAVKSSKAQERGLTLAVTEVPDRGDALAVGHKERMTTVNSGPSQRTCGKWPRRAQLLAASQN